MGYLIVEMLVCLLVAALIGVFFGWLLGRLRGRGETESVVESLREELQAVRASQQSAQESLEAAESKLVGLGGLAVQFADLERRARDTDAATSGLQGAVDDQSMSVARFQSELAARDDRLKRIQHQVDELAQLSVRVAEQSEVVDRMAGEMKTGFARMPKLEREVAELIGLREVSERHETALAAVEPELAERDGRIAGLVERVDAMGGVVDQMNGIGATMSELRGSVDSHGTALAAVEPSLQRRLEEQARKLSETLAQSLADRDRDFDELSSKVSAQHDVDEELRLRLDEPAQKIAELEPRIAAVEMITPRVESLGGRVGEAVGRLEEQTGLLTSVRIELSRRDERLDRIEAALKQHNETLEPLTARLTENKRREDGHVTRRIDAVESALAGGRTANQGVGEIRREIAELRVSFQRELSEHARQPHGAPAAPPKPPKPDDLTKIWGVGKVLERRLNELGIHTFAEIAALSRPEIERVQEGLDTIPDRIEREEWVEQARRLATGAPTQAAVAAVG